ncbi:hypothetical protein ACF0H5_006197 [Mactra antiquata]
MTEHIVNGNKTAGIKPQTLEDKEIKSDTNFLPPTPPSSVSDNTDSDDLDLGAVPKTVRREGRKILPPIPDSETEAEMSASIISKQNTMTGGSCSGQTKLEYILMNEYNMVRKHKLPGVYVIPSALSPLIWNGVIFIRQGLYQGAVFRFNLNIPENYPNGDCPRVFFEHLVFHPVIDSKFGELDVKREFKKWRRNGNFLWQVLMYVRRIFFKIDPKCPSNTEAAELYENNMEEFKKKVEDSVKCSKEVLYNPIESNDAHMIRFTPLEETTHEEAKTDMLTRKGHRSDVLSDPYKKNGLSWLKPGSTQIFSVEDSGTQ